MHNLISTSLLDNLEINSLQLTSLLYATIGYRQPCKCANYKFEHERVSKAVTWPILTKYS